MKPHLKIILFTHFYLTNVCAIAQTENLVTQRILYTVRLDNNEHKEGGFYNHLDSLTRTHLINQICDLIYERKLMTSYYWGEEVGGLPNYSPVGENKSKYYFKRNDTIRHKYNLPPYGNKTMSDVTRDNYVYRYLINSLSFYEKWYFDINTNIFSKRVTGIILFEDKYTQNIGQTCNYFVALNDTTTNEYNSKYLVAKNIIYDVPVSKGDTIFNEYNWWHNYIEASKRERLFNIFQFKALDDTILPFRTFAGKFPYDSLITKTKYINVGLGELFYGRSNWYASDPLLFGMTDEKIQARSFQLSDWTTIKKLRFHEEWFFDPNKFRFEKKVLGIGMIVDTFNDDGKKTGEKCLVYYKLN